jgi:hypothetical protein
MPLTESSEADRQRQQQAGFDHYYVKPMKLATLLELFKTLDEQPSFHDEPAAGTPP